jgi:hypothetical protein
MRWATCIAKGTTVIPVFPLLQQNKAMVESLLSIDVVASKTVGAK